MALSTKQREVFNLLRTKTEITVQDCCESGIINTYYNNSEKYISELLSNMAKTKLLERVKKGVYSKPQKNNIVELPTLF